MIHRIRRKVVGIRPRVKPGLFIIGSQKAGTTALFEMLALHPRIGASTPKELRFFSSDSNYAQGMKHYLSHFPPQSIVGVRKLGVEATGYMFQGEKTAARIKFHFPYAVCLATLRDPVKRAYSAWNMYHRFKDHPQNAKRYDARTFAQAVEDELAGRPYAPYPYHNYLALGCYAGQIEAYQKHFPAKQLLVRSYLDLKKDPDAFVHDVCVNVGIPPMEKSVSLKEVKPNTHAYPAPMDPGLAAELYRWFAPELAKLDEVLGYHLEILENPA
ncbi:MAG: sulfotransferase domain-containing protein [Flavobacteriales bacterium]|nr:sulfotransferase domain-containing protein [Flavobacteriales bacterium]